MSLPILISIPHGGKNRPVELDGHTTITDRDFFDDLDPFVTEIYNVKDKVQKVITTDIARTFVDLNRSLQDLPPKNPDGLIKSSTCYRKPIYIPGHEPDDQLTNMLIELYYKPYHRNIQTSIKELDLQVCLDCHSMAEFAPEIAPDSASNKRPLFCISNQDGKSSSQEMMEVLGESLSSAFGVDTNDISYNKPFKGGYITTTYGNNPIPWIQIEMNRSMYLSEPWFAKETLQIDDSRLVELNGMFSKTLDEFSSQIIPKM